MDQENLHTKPTRQAIPPIVRNRINVVAHRLAMEWENTLRRRLCELVQASAAAGKPLEDIATDVQEWADEKTNFAGEKND